MSEKASLNLELKCKEGHRLLPGNMGTGILCFSVKMLNTSSVTGVFSGA